MYKPAILPLIMLLAGSAQAGPEALLLDQLRVDHGALRAAERDFHQHQSQGALGPNEARDYAAYVDRLRQRLIRDCMALAAAGMVVPADVDCPQQRSTVSRPAAIDQQAERTDAEQAAALDAELNTGLGEFDQRLLREQERVKAAKPVTVGGSEHEGAGAGAGTGTGTDADADADAEGGSSGDLVDGGEPGTSEEPWDSGDMVESHPPSGAAGASRSQTTVSSQPEDIPDGSDDNVVARQLREAAERETNPERKKKLWEEYRRYKQGVR